MGYGYQAGGMHPDGMLSCFVSLFIPSMSAVWKSIYTDISHFNVYLEFNCVMLLLLITVLRSNQINLKSYKIITSIKILPKKIMGKLFMWMDEVYNIILYKYWLISDSVTVHPAGTPGFHKFLLEVLQFKIPWSSFRFLQVLKQQLGKYPKKSIIQMYVMIFIMIWSNFHEEIVWKKKRHPQRIA